MIGYQEKAHGMAVDAEDNVWITAAGSATVMKISPEGKPLLTIGETRTPRRLGRSEGAAAALGTGDGGVRAERRRLHRRGTRRTRVPTTPIRTIPANNIGASRIIHLDKNGKFIKQWYGNEVGQGKFSSAHGLAVDPTNGDVWIGDREEYRIVVYSAMANSSRRCR